MLGVGYSGEEQAGLTIGEAVEVFDVVLVGPRTLIFDVWEHEGDYFAHAAAVGGSEGP